MNSIPWSFKPYKPFFFETGDIYISRISPNKNDFTVEWLNTEKEYSVFLRKRNEGEFKEVLKTTDSTATIRELEENTEYEVFVQSKDKKSRVRIARCGEHEGVAINYLHPEDDAYVFSGHFIGSPSIIKHPDGFLLASMDIFTGDFPQNLTIIFRSDDGGKTWHHVSELMPCFWGKLFIFNNELYMVAVSTEYGDLLMGKSTDGGKTFTSPTVILRGSNGKNGQCGVHKCPQAPVIFNNRIYIAVEWGSWGRCYHAPTVISCNIDDDLLDYANWTVPHPVKYDPQWEGVAVGKSAGTLEGTLAVSPKNELLNVMRYQTGTCQPSYGLALVYKVDTKNLENPISYSYAMEFDANLSKFMIRKDEKTGVYYTICSRITEPDNIFARNLLSLMASTDLKGWHVVADLIDKRNEDSQKVGFQYVDFDFDGDDIIWVCRTAQNGANTYHNTNLLTFHRTKNFRDIK